jgi:hypothetical protein
MGIETSSFDDFLKAFLRGRSNPWGSWGAHVEFWLATDSAKTNRLLLVKYEDLRRDTEGVFRQVLQFLGVEARDEVVKDAIANNSLEAMRSKEDKARQEGWRPTARSDIRFINTGTVTGWREKLTTEQAKSIERHFARPLSELGYL